MTDTHINAYYMDVTEAENNLVKAQSALSQAKQRLDAKKLEDGVTDESSDTTEEVPSEEVQDETGGEVPEKEDEPEENTQDSSVT